MKKYFHLLAALLLLVSINADEKTQKLTSLLPKQKGMTLYVKDISKLKELLNNHPIAKNQELKLMDELESFSDLLKEELEEEANEFYDLFKEKLLPSNLKQLAFQFYNDDYTYESEYHFIIEGEQEIFLETLDKIVENVNEEEGNTNITEKKEFKNYSYFLIKEDFEKAIKASKDSGEFDELTEAEIEEYKKEIQTSIQHNAVCLAVVNNFFITCNNEINLHKVLSAIESNTDRVDSIHTNKDFYANLMSSENKNAILYLDYREDNLNPEEISAEEKAFQIHLMGHFWFSLEIKSGQDIIEAQWLQPTPLEGIFKILEFKEVPFKPSAFISSKIQNWGYLSFNMSNALNYTLELLKNTNPQQHQQMEAGLQMGQAQFGIDIKAFIDSIGETFETFNIVPEKGDMEGYTIFHLKNKKVFEQSLTTILSNPLVKAQMEQTIILTEDKNNNNHTWTIKLKDPNKKESFAMGLIDNYFFFSDNANNGQKLLNILSSKPEKQLADTEGYKNNRNLYKANLSSYSFASLTSLIRAFQFGVNEGIKEENIEDLDDEDNPFLKLLNKITKLDANQVKGHFNMAAFYEQNKFKVNININH